MKKAIVQKTQTEPVEHQVRFETQRFNSLVFDKGYDVFIDRAYRCPCLSKGVGQPLADCENCLGVGWVYANRVETRLAVQSIKADVKYENWTQTTSGTAKVTARVYDKLAFMDRIILRDVEGYYNEVLRIRKREDKPFFFTNYPILEVEDIMIFNGSKNPLIYLKEGTDYQFEKDETQIELIGAYADVEKLTATIRYRHIQTYHVIDMNRDITKVREKGCALPDEALKGMPVMGIIRKAHYLFDNNKYKEAEELIENTKEIEN